MSTTEADKITSIFNLYTKYRYRTYNNIISSDSQIFKFKERVNNYNKIFGDMESKKFVQKEPESIQIMVKEGKEKKVYTEEFDTIPEEEEEEKTVIEKPVDAKPIEKKPGEKTFVVLGGYPDIVEAIAKRGYKQSKDPTDKSYELVNYIRHRAGLGDMARNLNQDEFRQAVIQERKFEMAYEGDYMYDLRRTNRIQSVAEAAGLSEDQVTFYPIPQAEINLNGSLR